jgi:hypothetical protein
MQVKADAGYKVRASASTQVQLPAAVEHQCSDPPLCAAVWLQVSGRDAGSFFQRQDASVLLLGPDDCLTLSVLTCMPLP